MLNKAHITISLFGRLKNKKCPEVPVKKKTNAWGVSAGQYDHQLQEALQNHPLGQDVYILESHL